jgi:hypothetical protein
MGKGKGKEKRQFLTEKASDRESFGLFRHNMAKKKKININTTHRGGFQ